MADFKQAGNGIFIGGQPTAEDLQAASEQGIRAVIDLRLPGETAAPTEPLARCCGLDYINLPVDKTALAESLVGQFGQVLAAAPRPVLVYCATGARAAMLLALNQDQGRSGRLEPAQVFAHAQAIGYDLQAMPAFDAFVRQVTDKPAT